MYSLVGFSNVIKILYILSIEHSTGEKNLINLKKAIKTYLTINFKESTYSNQLDPEILYQGASLNLILQSLDLQNDTTPYTQQSLKLQKAYANKVEESLNQLQFAEEIYSLFYLAIDTIAVTSNIKFSGSATTPKAIGMMWIQPDEKWEKEDFTESLIHEFTHTLLGYDNLVNYHYEKPKEIMDKKNWVPSAIRNEERPVNGVAHSIIVGIEILNFRKLSNCIVNKNNVHGSSIELFRKTARAVENLKNKKESWEILSERMQYLINEAELSLLKLSEEENQYEPYIYKL